MRGALLGCCLLLQGCASVPEALSAHHFFEPTTGFHLETPRNFTRRETTAGYWITSTWRVDAAANQPGEAVADWVLTGSNDVMQAFLRFGFSAASESVEHCLSPAIGDATTATNQVMLGGLPFTHYGFSDAGMSHFIEVDAYRSHHAGRCLAIDLVVQGTNPLVYDPPRQEPFSQAQAKHELHALLLRVEWLADEN